MVCVCALCLYAQICICAYTVGNHHTYTYPSRKRRHNCTHQALLNTLAHVGRIMAPLHDHLSSSRISTPSKPPKFFLQGPPLSPPLIEPPLRPNRDEADPADAAVGRRVLRGARVAPHKRNGSWFLEFLEYLLIVLEINLML